MDGAHAFHVDCVRAPAELDEVLEHLPQNKILSLGVVDGRNIWKNDFAKSLKLLTAAKATLGAQRLWVAPSCSLLHSPVTLASEPALDAQIENWLAFADEKLTEVVTLSALLRGTSRSGVLEANQDAIHSRATSRRTHNPEVRARLALITEQDARRHSPFPQRQPLQHARLALPEFPTTTIGSFPQTAEVRSMRARWKKGELTTAEYEVYLENETRACVAFQDEIGLDMPVHGEFERNDMVEYFGEQLDGFLFTANGWVQSYGTRCVKPPIIYGDVSRPAPMTVRWAKFAQSLTPRPMKGMLTGPVTILNWSPTTYRHLLEKYNFDADDFFERLGSETYKEKAYYEFALCKQLQVTGFPAVMLQLSENKFYLLSRGFTPFDELKERIDNVLKETATQ